MISGSYKKGPLEVTVIYSVVWKIYYFRELKEF